MDREVIAVTEKECSGTINPLNKCSTDDARYLCIFDIYDKLQKPNEYDIGGSYSESRSDLWFYFNTSVAPGNNYMLNLFTCHRSVGNFSIDISFSNELEQKLEKEICCLKGDKLTAYTFQTVMEDECRFIKSFCFTAKDLKIMEKKILLIPIRIQKNPCTIIKEEVIQGIKLAHDLIDMFKQRKPDYVLKSSNGTEFEVHKVIMAAHSPVLREMLKSSNENSLTLDISDNEMGILLNFLKYGTISNNLKEDCLKAMELAMKFELQGLVKYCKSAITVDNAIQMAILTEKYRREDVQEYVFKFVKEHHKEVMKSDGWDDLDNVVLAKKMFRYIQLS